MHTSQKRVCTNCISLQWHYRPIMVYIFKRRKMGILCCKIFFKDDIMHSSKQTKIQCAQTVKASSSNMDPYNYIFCKEDSGDFTLAYLKKQHGHKQKPQNLAFTYSIVILWHYRPVVLCTFEKRTLRALFWIFFKTSFCVQTSMKY